VSEKLIISAFEYLIKNEEETAPIFKQEIFEETLKLLRQQQDHIAGLNTSLQMAKAEIKRLQALADAELDSIHALGDDYERLLKEESELVEKARIEAINEFAEKLRENIKARRKAERTNFAKLRYGYCLLEIDNVKKEMLEVMR
jgi:hypothetical protein